MKIINKCPICDSNKLKRLRKFFFKNPFQNYQHLTKVKGLNFFVDFCEECGFIFLNPRFSEEERKILNKKRYGNKKVHNLGLIEKKRITKRSQKIFNYIERRYRFSFDKKLHLLDYGGGNGLILLSFLEYFRCNIIDFRLCEMPKGINYLGKDLKSINKEEKFDIILLIHTLEHIHNPKEFLKILTNHLKKNGLIFIQVPLGSFREWRSLDVPHRHINFFSEQSLYNCFKYTNCNILDLRTGYNIFDTNRFRHLNLIGIKNSENDFIKIKKLSSTKMEWVKFSNYFYLLLNLRKIAIRKIKIFFLKTARNFLVYR
jgi:SAM-dependent methyltransferase